MGGGSSKKKVLAEKLAKEEETRKEQQKKNAEIENLVKFLQKLPLISQIANLEILQEYCKEVLSQPQEYFPENYTILEKDEENDKGIYLILEGSAQVSTKKRDLIYVSLSSSDYFGELSTIFRTKVSAKVQSVSPLKAILFAKKRIQEILENVSWEQDKEKLHWMCKRRYFDCGNFFPDKNLLNSVIASESLSKLPLFANLDLSLLPDIVSVGETMIYRPHTYLWKRKDPCISMVVLLRGALQIVDNEGDQVFATIHDTSSEPFLCESSLYGEDLRRHCNVRTANQVAHVFVITRENFICLWSRIKKKKLWNENYEEIYKKYQQMMDFKRNQREKNLGQLEKLKSLLGEEEGELQEEVIWSYFRNSKTFQASDFDTLQRLCFSFDENQISTLSDPKQPEFGRYKIFQTLNETVAENHFLVLKGAVKKVDMNGNVQTSIFRGQIYPQEKSLQNAEEQQFTNQVSFQLVVDKIPCILLTLPSQPTLHSEMPQ